MNILRGLVGIGIIAINFISATRLKLAVNLLFLGCSKLENFDLSMKLQGDACLV